MLLLLLFITVPLIEIALFVQLGSVLDLGWILLIVVLTAILGTVIVRRQGRDVLQQIGTAFERMQDPTEPIAHGAMVLFSGALLLTPGFFTDGIGFLLLIPAVRRAVYRWMKSRAVVSHGSSSSFRVHSGVRMRAHTAAGTSPRTDDTVVEGEFTDVTDDAEHTKRGKSGWTQAD